MCLQVEAPMNSGFFQDFDFDSFYPHVPLCAPKRAARTHTTAGTFLKTFLLPFENKLWPAQKQIAKMLLIL